ncbi:MAG TPA: hypothetical protein VHA33_03975 [Candidatus Angelobacter sp.]|jgi:hypothetical protein|nr:hypothetical protein [Candidatus Angelobacter sp.]
MKKLLMFLMAAVSFAAISFAQTTTASEEHNRVFVQKGSGEGIGLGEGRGIGIENIEGATARAYTFDIGGDREVVKNAPYTATSVTEITQSLADGNRIVNKNTSFIARDSQGRTRHEENLGGVGGLPLKGMKIVSINDPVAGTSFIFKSGDEKSADSENHGEAKVVRVEERKKVRVFTTGGKGEAWVEQRGDVKHESLGVKTIEGVSAEGKRETRTIAAGAIGNERPIEITSETWYSPDLHTVVLSKRNDPRIGETTMHLTGINRGEPDASLFQPPPGSKLDTDHQGKTFIYKTHPKEEE